MGSRYRVSALVILIISALTSNMLWAEKIIVIGDSLSDDGQFGKTLAQHLSSGQNIVTSFAVSNSNFKSWSDGDFSCCHHGFHRRSYVNGEYLPKYSSKGETPPAGLSLSALLNKNSNYSPSPGVSVNRLIVQLGTNLVKNLNLEEHKIYLNKILQQACANEVQNVNFILPPQNLQQNMLSRDQSFARQINGMLTGDYFYSKDCPKGVKVSYFPSATIPITKFFVSPKYGQDPVHFWNIPESEGAWFEAIKGWAKGGYLSPAKSAVQSQDPNNSSELRIKRFSPKYKFSKPPHSN